MAGLSPFTVSKNSHRPFYLQVVSVLAIGYLFYYLWWRVTATLNPDALVFSWVLVLAEAFGALSYVLFAWMTQDISPTRAFQPPKPGSSVDVFVPTVDESLDILEATLAGCNQVSYPHRTYILDDGRRKGVQELALRLGCEYLTRETSEHAKAGNINAALARTGGEFVVILDADMVPQRDFLDKTLGYFEDPRLAFIQMPQEFYNQDSIQHDLKADRWHEQSLFFRIIQPGKNHSNSAFWCGSPSVIRRRALEDVGGAATSTITEDIHTSVRWHSRGWSSYFLNEPLAFGIAPQTIRAFLLQRLRWASGTMQLYASHESPLRISGLTLRQRISYFASFMAYFESFQKLVLLATPIVIVLFNVFPMRVNMFAFLLRWVPYFAVCLAASHAGGRGHFRYFQTEKYSILKMVVFIQSTLTFFTRKSLKFEVTPKSMDTSVYAAETRGLLAYFVIYGILTGTVVYGLLRIPTWDNAALGVEALVITLSWALYNAFTILGGVSDVLSRPHNRMQYRFPVDVHGELGERGRSIPLAHVQICDLSLSGVGFIGDSALTAPSTPASLTFYSSHRKRITLPLLLANRRPLGPAGKAVRGASIVNIDAPDRERLFEFLFVDIPEKWRNSLAQPPTAADLPLAAQPLQHAVPVPAPVPVQVPGRAP